MNNLLEEKYGDFNLQKYFISYHKIKQKPEFQACELEDLTIFTYIDFDNEARNIFERVVGEDDILDIESHDKEPKRFKLAKNNPQTEELRSILLGSSDLQVLVEELADCVSKNQSLNLRNGLFKEYHMVLAEHVIDINANRFKGSFINEINLSERENKEFKKVLLDTFKKHKITDWSTQTIKCIRVL